MIRSGGAPRRAIRRLRAGVERRLGELDGPHVRLMDDEPWRPFVQHVGEGAAGRLDAGGPRGQRSVDDAVGRDDPGQIEFRDRLDDSRAADAGDAEALGRLGEARRVRPEVAADHLEAGLERLPVDAHPLDRAGGGALAAGDLRALEGRPCRRRGGDEPFALAEYDLGVGADVDDQPELVAKMGRLGQHDARRVRPDMAGDAGQGVDI